MGKIGDMNGGHEGAMGEAHRSVPVPRAGWRRGFAFAGPGLMIAVGYMDPGNWATDLAGGSRYGYALLWVILASNLMAILLQTLCVRLGIATGKDLARTCRDAYAKPAAIALWLLAEIAIIATDVAEVIGSAVALKLLFGLPLAWGILITGFDVLILLALTHFGWRKLEAAIGALVATIVLCFAINVFWARPDWGGVLTGTFTPSLPDKQALGIAVGIIGATVMPHNLYLHSALVQTRAIEDKRHAIRSATIDTVISLGMAFFVNAAILVLAAAVFYRSGTEVTELEQAHRLIAPALGGVAATLFAVALLASGQSSTVTGTLAGQAVMEGFLNLKVKPWIRRVVTRGLAIVPAMLVVGVNDKTGTVDPLVVSQIVLSLQLPFAIVPLILETARRRRMGEFVSPIWMTGLAAASAGTIVALNVAFLGGEFGWPAVGVMAATVGGFAAWVRFGHRRSVRSEA